MLAAALLSGVLGAPPGLPALAAPLLESGPCSGDEGVTVVVDFGTLNDAVGVQTRCAVEPVTSGFDALTKAGFDYDVVPGGFLCRIDGLPADEPCTHTPSASYYWSYWLASEPGGEWTYSDMGAGNRDPAPGSVDGWAFVDGCTREPGEPTACPTSSTASSASSTTTRPLGSGGGTGTTTPGLAAATTTHSDAMTSDPHGTTTTVSGDATIGQDRSSALADDDVRGGVALGDGDDAAAKARVAQDGGSPVGVLVGAAAVALLTLDAARRVRVRRERGPGQGLE